MLIVAFLTRRGTIELPPGVAYSALQLSVILVERLSSDVVVERRGCPVIVTTVALAIQGAKGHIDVAGTASNVSVIPIQRPAGVGMGERLRLWLAFQPVASFTSAGHPTHQVHVALMAVNAGSVVRGDCLGLGLLPFRGMAPCTASLMVTIHAPESETLRMLPVPEEYLPSGKPFGSKSIEVSIWLRDHRMDSAQNVIFGHRRRGVPSVRAACLCPVTHIAISLIDPAAVAVQALLVVGAA